MGQLEYIVYTLSPQVGELVDAKNGLEETNLSLLESVKNLKHELDDTKALLDEAKVNSNSSDEIDKLKVEVNNHREANAELEQTNQSLMESVASLKNELSTVSFRKLGQIPYKEGSVTICKEINCQNDCFILMWH